MTEPQNTEPTTDVTPPQPVEDVDFDENLDPELDESNADFDAEEQNPKEATA